MFGYPQALMSGWRRIGLSLTIALLLPVCLKAENTRKVLVLHQGSPNFPAIAIMSGVFRNVFGSDMRNQLFEEFIDEDRLSADDKTLADILRRKYQGQKIDLVVGQGRATLNFLLRRGEELWPGIPKVVQAVEVRQLPAKLPPNMTGVAGTIDLGATLDLALQLKPNTRHVFYVGGVDPAEEELRGFAEQDFKRFAGRVEIIYLTHLPLVELLDRLGRLPDNSVVIYALIQVDAAGHAYVPARVCPLVASASNAPVYGLFETYLGCGIVGGVTVDFKVLASQAANLALQVLERGTASGFPVERTPPNRTAVDWRQLQRWGISETKLSPGTIVRYRNPSLWEQYKWYMLAGLAAIFAQFALILMLVVEMRRRKKSDLGIKNLSGRLINASEEERKRIARELHDDVGQRLSLVCMDLSMMEPDSQNKATAECSLHQSMQQLNEIVTDVHNLSHQLHSSKLQMLGLEVALKEVCQQLARQHEIEIRLTTDGVPFPLREDLALCFYRVAQEALNNSVKHSGSARAEVRVGACDGTLRMTIKDYGAGFDPSVAANGLGLATMRERLKLVEGELLVNSKPGGGTEVTAQARLDPSLRQNKAA